MFDSLQRYKYQITGAARTRPIFSHDNQFTFGYGTLSNIWLRHMVMNQLLTVGNENYCERSYAYIMLLHATNRLFLLFTGFPCFETPHWTNRSGLEAKNIPNRYNLSTTCTKINWAIFQIKKAWWHLIQRTNNVIENEYNGIKVWAINYIPFDKWSSDRPIEMYAEAQICSNFYLRGQSIGSSLRPNSFNFVSWFDFVAMILFLRIVGGKEKKGQIPVGMRQWITIDCLKFNLCFHRFRQHLAISDDFSCAIQIIQIFACLNFLSFRLIAFYHFSFLAAYFSSQLTHFVYFT